MDLITTIQFNLGGFFRLKSRLFWEKFHVSLMRNYYKQINTPDLAAHFTKEDLLAAFTRDFTKTKLKGIFMNLLSFNTDELKWRQF